MMDLNTLAKGALAVTSILLLLLISTLGAIDWMVDSEDESFINKSASSLTIMGHQIFSFESSDEHIVGAKAVRDLPVLPPMRQGPLIDIDVQMTTPLPAPVAEPRTIVIKQEQQRCHQLTLPKGLHPDAGPMLLPDWRYDRPSSVQDADLPVN